MAAGGVGAMAAGGVGAMAAGDEDEESPARLRGGPLDARGLRLQPRGAAGDARRCLLSVATGGAADSHSCCKRLEEVSSPARLET